MPRTIYVEAKGGQSNRPNMGLKLLYVALAMLLIAMISGVGATVCALDDTSKHFEYTEYFDGKLTEESRVSEVAPAYPGYSDTRVAIATNAGTLPMYARMSIEPYWAEADSTGTWTRSVDESLDTSLIEVGYNLDGSWEYGDDGWWYYLAQIQPGESTTSLLTGITLSTQIGEENNDGTNHEVSSIYLNKAANVDVNLQCTTDPTFGTVPKTGEVLSPLTMVLITITLLAALACIALALLSRRRKCEGTKDKDAYMEVEL